MRILYITTIGKTMSFFKALISDMVNDKIIVDIATNEMQGKTPVPTIYREIGCEVFNIDCCRNPFDKNNIKAVRQIRELVERQHYDIVHCHTPIAAACTRFACQKARKNGTKVVYTAHGFHFYTGAPIKNWVIYYPIEKICSFFTDAIITINTEDYERALRSLNARDTYYVPGVGIDYETYSHINVDRNVKRKTLGIPEESFLIVSVGELNRNKNHVIVIRAIAEINNPNIHYVIAGEGEYKEQLLQIVKELGVESQVHLLGFRTDVPELYACADLCAFPSIREGQGIAALEGMAAGLPLVASDNRGMRGILVDKQNALICKYDDVSMFSKAILRLVNDTNLRKKMGVANRQLSKKYDVNVINNKMREIYSSLID